jgi:hypothetical protein
MSVLFWNCANGALAKFDFIEHLIKSENPEILFITEAEIKLGRDFNCLAIPGCEIEFGGTLKWGKTRQIAYVKHGSGFNRHHDLENDMSEIMVFWKDGLRICGVYRPFKNIQNLTNKEAFQILIDQLNALSSTPDDVLIAGDMNVNWYSTSVLKARMNEWSEAPLVKKLST